MESRNAGRAAEAPQRAAPTKGWTFQRGLAGTGVIFLGAVVGSLQFVRPSAAAPLEPFARIAKADSVLAVGASANAFGASREVRALVRQAQSNFFPQVSLNASRIRTVEGMSPGQTLGINNTTTVSDRGISGNWTIDLWGQIRRQTEGDRNSLHVAYADEAYLIESYLNQERLLETAARAGAEAVHPGYGFLAENADFARACQAAGLVWIGPPPEAIDVMGSKTTARETMSAAGVPIVVSTTFTAPAAISVIRAR